ncbi:hypothetical protein [Mucilaginibacter ginsenosidivorans]|uniref:Uncharacterized protein n=1 Tax=Mucilaginibacter ginsenosidivorans TaxID=398053 RepID=A0A5B8UWT5_9SPHI|nr:hypothetical protein [Mucilaginibacter ginsenosidivorans]QEC62856.1 hypothetical protein FRZ54_09790 [Mucilaginibacter ginsenosidivorans]
MKNLSKPASKLTLKKELSRNEMKQVTGGSTQQTYCDGYDRNGYNPFPVAGSMPIGCMPAYCPNAHHGAFLYCA